MQLKHLKIKEINTSKKYYTGSVFTTKNCGDLVILGQLPTIIVNENKYTYYRVQFSTGYITDAESCNIYRGTITDPYVPTVCTYGYLGEGVWKAFNNGKSTKEYNLWRNILERSYSKRKKEECPTYKDCTMDSRWHCFQVFCEDIQYLEGYAKWKSSTIPVEYELDKDIKSPTNKHYSKDNCQFVTRLENNREMHKRNKESFLNGCTYKGCRITDKYEEEFVNQAAFKAKYNITGSIESVVRGERNRTQTCGWTFKYKGEGLYPYTWIYYIGERVRDGYTEEFVNKKEFAHKYNLSVNGILYVLRGNDEGRKHRGWRFKIIREKY